MLYCNSNQLSNYETYKLWFNSTQIMALNRDFNEYSNFLARRHGMSLCTRAHLHAWSVFWRRNPHLWDSGDPSRTLGDVQGKNVTRWKGVLFLAFYTLYPFVACLEINKDNKDGADCNNLIRNKEKDGDMLCTLPTITWGEQKKLGKHAKIWKCNKQ